MCIIFVHCFGSFAQYVDIYVYKYVDNVSILLYVLLYYYINTKICPYSPDPNTNICSNLGKMGKNRAFYIGGTKNQNKCSVFQAAYKLLHLHTNLIFKHSIQNLQNTTKSPLSHHPIQNPNIAPNIVKPN